MALPKSLLTKNSRLQKSGGIWNWTIPALTAVLTDGTKVVTCPEAGACARFCYARSGAYLWNNVKAAHLQRLEFALANPAVFVATMIKELQKPKYRGCAIRIHDSGDFFSDGYTDSWLEIIDAHPELTFYAYTKEVSRFKLLKSAGRLSANFITIFSLGGKQDNLIDLTSDRHNDVFPTLEGLELAGYICASDDDNVAWRSPNYRIGVLANNIPAFKKKMNGLQFSELESLRSRYF